MKIETKLINNFSEAGTMDNKIFAVILEKFSAIKMLTKKDINPIKLVTNPLVYPLNEKYISNNPKIMSIKFN